MKTINNFKNFFINFHKRFVSGSLGTKISHFIMGFNNLKNKQIVKGLIYLFIQIGYLVLMIASPKINGTPLGFKSFKGLITLGENEGGIFTTEKDDSSLMLLFGVVIVVLTILYLIAWLSNINSSSKADMDIKNGKKPTSFKEDVKELLDKKFYVTLLTPTLIGVTIFTIIPTIYMILIAFTNYDAEHQGVLFDWVGVKNFAAIFVGQGEIAARFLPVLSWTVIWAIIATLSCYLMGILVAVIINQDGLKGKKLFRTILILTIAMPQFVSLLAVRQLVSEYGPLQSMLIDLGLLSQPTSLLSNASNGLTPKIIILITNLWIGLPYTMLITSGILLNIPKDLKEAATIDGASPSKIFTKITMPYVIFVTTPYLISAFIGNINSFNIIYLLTGGGPVVAGYKAGQTDLLVTWLFKLTIDENMYNLGSVIGIITFIITSTITLLTYRRTKAYKEEDTFQ